MLISNVAISQGVGTKPRRWEVSWAVGSFSRHVKSGIDCPIYDDDMMMVLTSAKSHFPLRLHCLFGYRASHVWSEWGYVRCGRSGDKTQGAVTGPEYPGQMAGRRDLRYSRRATSCDVQERSLVGDRWHVQDLAEDQVFHRPRTELFSGQCAA